MGSSSTPVQKKQFLGGVGEGGIPSKKDYNEGISSSLLEIFI